MSKQPKYGDYNLYQSWHNPGEWVLEVYGIGGEMVGKYVFGSVTSARMWILNNWK